MTKLILTLFFLGSFFFSLFSQNLKTELQSHVWYCTGKLDDTSSITLVNSKPAIFNFIANFNSPNQLLLTYQDYKTDSMFSYVVNKDYLNLGYETKDSMQNLSFHAVISADKKTILLQRSISFKVSYMGSDTITYDSFWLSKRKRSSDISRYDNIILYSKLSDTSKFVERTRGDFYKLGGDSLFIDTESFASSHFYMTRRDTIPPHLKIIPLHNIKKIYHERESLNYITGCGIGLSVLSTLIVSPLVSIQKNGFNGDRYLRVAGISLASSVFFITLRVGLSHKKMVINNRRSSWKIW